MALSPMHSIHIVVLLKGEINICLHYSDVGLALEPKKLIYFKHFFFLIAQSNAVIVLAVFPHF